MMDKNAVTGENKFEKIPLNLAIVGGGRTCKSFLELIERESLPYLNICIVGVCDIDSEAVGFLLAKEMGIYTTNHFEDLFRIKNLDGVVELTGRREVLLELIRHRPKGIGVLEHNISRLLRYYFITDQRLKTAEQQVVIEKMASDFLIQQANERIVVLNPDFTISEANRPYLKAVGGSREQVIGAHCYEVTHRLSAPCSSSDPGLGCPLVE
ncbi:MAG: PAS domain-containing sensor histidine kinase, partial [Deltaproteobacteria bacterium]|nr:PAS domain-containing sensor histidine kinase [Deltaproteobacteria bacterium]